MDLWAAFQQFVNLQAALLAAVLTQAIKFFLPSPGAIPSVAIEKGKWWTRAMPFVPVLLGMLIACALEWDAKLTVNDWVRGAMSGVFAAYLYRTTKVTFLGE